ncbi:hypothetical protein KIM372_00320 [Bombiscardovia nodaiensis]|uniref:Uncharacterized protein n=1 Tax=Bombiscardovia nodaiensis TaxID=2932181 RepID=A0ABM8B5K9_9BIFI|nr:hypothetical protein KIM372_00320 [Bombiscardovia nodaiensis]
MKMRTWADLLGLYDRDTVLEVMEILEARVTTLRHVDAAGRVTPAPASACRVEDWTFDEPAWRVVCDCGAVVLQVQADALENQEVEHDDDPDDD